MAVAEKHETRSWSTSYRGDVLICSTQNSPGGAFSEGLIRNASRLNASSYDRLGWDNGGLAHGVALCVVELVGCSPVEEWKLAQLGAGMPEEVEAQDAMGDLSSGRFVWVFRNRRALSNPIPVKGHQGLWTVSPELEKAVLEELEKGRSA